MARVEDLWVRKDKTRTPVYGKGMRDRAEWTEPGGHKKRKSFRTKAAAQDYLAQQITAINSGTYVAGQNRIMFEDYAATWQDHQLHHRPASREQVTGKFRGYILPSFSGNTLDSIRRADVQAAVGEWASHLAPSTVKVTYGYLAGLFKAAVLDGAIPKSPCVGIRLPKVEEEAVIPLRTEVVQMLAERIYKPFRPMVVFCAATGMRSAEMRGLTWDRVDFRTSMVTIDRQLTTLDSSRPEWGPPKTASSRRTIHVGAQTMELLKRLRQDPVGPGGLVFHAEGLAITRKSASQVWRSARERVPGLGDTGTGWHQLRHYAASLWISGGMSPVAVAFRLGHKDATETLRTYAHIWPSDDTRAAELSDGVIRLPSESTDN